MARAFRIPASYRFFAGAIAVSAALHAAVFVGMPAELQAVDRSEPEVFSARLDAAAPAPPTVEPPTPPRPPARKAKPRTRIARPHPAPAPVPQVLAAMAPSSEAPAVALPMPETPPPAPLPPPVAMAEPILPWFPAPPTPVQEPPIFPMEALPAHLSVAYELHSGPLGAEATYRWDRDGDGYRITGEGEAVGLFQLFLDGPIRQESVGTITAAGLRPERFLERKPGSDAEGLEFDWPRHTVTLERGASRKTAILADDTVDWLTMIFQLASVPPRAGGAMLPLRVYTQRKLYDFQLKVLGIEEIEIPLGKVRALHLRHVDADDGRETDVWLGIDQHYLPVKMRYPVAKMRLMVEQSAARISER
jgi:Protein of unknown function (DUF3108)